MPVLRRNNIESVASGMFYEAVTTSDSANLTNNARALWIGTAGNVAVVGVDGNAVTFKNAASGTLIPVVAIRVNATNTTASDIVAIY